MVMSYQPQAKVIYTGKIGSKKSLKELEEMAKTQFELGSWSTNKKEHPIRHEYGHHIFHELTDYDTITREKINKIYLEKYKEILDNKKWNKDDCSKYTKQVMDAEVSFYGLENIQEFGAECIAEYLSGNPRSVAKEVCKILLGKR